MLSDQSVPTASGLLFAGKDPLHWFAGAYVQFLKGSRSSFDVSVAEQPSYFGHSARSNQPT